MQPVLELKNVNVSLRNKPVLEAINLELFANDILAILGPNGGGKTTLLKTILGLVKPQQGVVKVFSTDAVKARGQIGYVPQSARFDWDFPISVYDVVRMGRLGRSTWKLRFDKVDNQATEEALNQVSITHLRKEPIGKLSMGQLQRVLIARALTVEPKLLLLDEPTASLDTQVGHELYELIESLAEHMAIIMVTHDIGVISRYVKKIGCLNRRYHQHGGKEITAAMLEEVYGCPVDLIAHGVPHRVLHEHD